MLVRAGKIKTKKWVRGITIENGADITQRVQF
jgi:hypothetical protein